MVNTLVDINILILKKQNNQINHSRLDLKNKNKKFKPKAVLAHRVVNKNKV
jgi:hypothetical protein